MSTQGKVWGLSATTWTAGPIYNVDLLHKAGYSGPPATWADFLKLCSTLKGLKVTPVYDTAVPPAGTLLVGLIGGYYMRHYGKNIDPEIFTGKISFVDAWTEPLTAYSELYTQGLVSTAYLGLTGTEIDSLMAQGKLGIYASGPWDLATISADNPSLKLLMGPTPGPAAGQGYWEGSPNVAWAVNAKAQNPDAALAFLSFLASPPGLKPYVAEQGYPCAMSNYTPSLPSSLTLALRRLAAATTTSTPHLGPKLHRPSTPQLGVRARGRSGEHDPGKTHGQRRSHAHSTRSWPSYGSRRNRGGAAVIRNTAIAHRQWCRHGIFPAWARYRL